MKLNYLSCYVDYVLFIFIIFILSINYMYDFVDMNLFYCLMLKIKGIYIIYDIGISFENLKCFFIYL